MQTPSCGLTDYGSLSLVGLDDTEDYITPDVTAPSLTINVDANNLSSVPFTNDSKVLTITLFHDIRLSSAPDTPYSTDATIVLTIYNACAAVYAQFKLSAGSTLFDMVNDVADSTQYTYPAVFAYEAEIAECAFTYPNIATNTDSYGESYIESIEGTAISSSYQV